MEAAAGGGTEEATYTSRLDQLEKVWWKRLLDVQRPYRANLRRMGLGRVLDVGCGLGRNLTNLGGHGVGVDHNPDSVAVAVSRGLVAFTPEAFLASEHARPGRFDAMLLAHVAEHLQAEDLLALVRTYLPFLDDRRRVVLITPQERGFATDPTHVRFVDDEALRETALALSARIASLRSFPFPRPAGRVFPYNEFVLDCSGAA